METRTQEFAMGQALKFYAVPEDPHPTFITPTIIVPVDAVEFPDVSFYQGEINWDIMASKTKAVLIRAGQNLWIDSQFERNYTLAGERSIKRGVYWFYDDRKTPKQQADLLISLLKGREPEMEVVNDWERNFGGAYFGLPYACEFQQRVEDGLPSLKFLTAMYTGFYWFVDHSDPKTHASQYTFLSRRSLHIAWYSDPAIVRIPNPPWTNWTHWQLGTPARGHEFGCETIEIDMNKFNGNNAAFDLRYGTATNPPPNGGTMKIGTVTASGLNIRTGPGTNYPQFLPPLGALKTGDQVIGELDPATNWLHFEKIIRVNGTEEIHDGWSSAVGWQNPEPPYMSIADYTPPTDPGIPATIENTQEWKDDSGSVIATFKGTLTRQ